jgi:peptidoglycan/LPS O-acetylase OafA/YrhL
MEPGYNPWFWLSMLSFTANYWLAISSYAYPVHWGVLWSLSVEEQFYLFYPLLLKKLGGSRNLARFLIFLIPGSLLARWAVFLHDPSLVLKFLITLGAFDQIAVGALLCLAVQRFGPRLALRPWICVFLFLAGSILGLGTYFLASADSGSDMVWAPTLLSLGLFLILLGGLHLNFFESPWFTPLGLCGKYCYGAYLLHEWVLHLVRRPLMNMETFQAYGIFVLLTTALAAFSYHFLEMPLNRWIRNRFALGSGLKLKLEPT